MTNAEKYKLTGIEAYNLSLELGEYLTIEKKAEGVFVSDINSFFARATKPTLTEDERVILRNLKSIHNCIGRNRNGDIQLICKEPKLKECIWHINLKS